MRKLALALLLLFVPTAIRASYTVSRDCFPGGGGGGPSSDTCNTGSVVSPGTLYVVGVSVYQNNASSISDDQSNTWSSAPNTVLGTSAGFESVIYYSTITSSNVLNITVNYNTTGNFRTVWFLRITSSIGSFSASPLDKDDGRTFTTNAGTQSTTGGKTILAGDIVVSVIMCNSGSQTEFSTTAGWTDEGHSGVTSAHGAYYDSPSAGAFDASWSSLSGCTFSGGTYGVISYAAFKAPSSANPGGGPQSQISQNRRFPRSLPVVFAATAWKREREVFDLERRVKI